jgi:hypothetical protein
MSATASRLFGPFMDQIAQKLPLILPVFAEHKWGGGIRISE